MNHLEHLKLYTLFRNISIRNKFILVNFIAILLSFLFLSIASSYTIQRSNLHRIQSDYDRTMEQSMHSIERVFNNASSISKIIAPNSWVQQYYLESTDDYKTLEQKALIQSFLNTVTQPDSSYSSIVIYGLDGRNIASNTTPDKVNPQIRNQVLFSNHVSALQANRGTPLYLTPQQTIYINEKKSENYLSMLSPIVSTASGNIVAVLEIIFSEPTISKLLTPLYSTDNVELFVMDENGTILSSPTPKIINTSISNTKVYQALQANADSSDFNQFIRVDGSTYLTCMKKSSDLNWCVVSMIPESSVNEQVAQNFFVTLAIIVIAFFISLVCSFALSNSVCKPIKSLCDSIDHVAEGDLSINTPVLGNDEIGYLSQRFNNMLVEISSLITQVTQEKLLRRESQLLALQAQINPHFLYNTLESIASLISLNMRNDAINMTHSLEVFYKTSLSGGKNVITIEKEVQNITTYLEILKFRYRDLFEYSIECPGKLKHYAIAKLTIQPLIENAIYHGIRQQSKKGMLTIQCVKEIDEIRIYVTDNGPGIEPDRFPILLSQPGNSYGLYNVNERIRLYFGRDYGLLIDDSYTDGARICVRIPALTDSNETTIKLHSQGEHYDTNTDC